MHETKHTSFYISVKAALDKTLFFFLFAIPGVDPRRLNRPLATCDNISIELPRLRRA